MRYENLLSRSWAILRRHPWLWLLALLAGETFSGGGVGGGSSFTGPTSTSATTPDLSWVQGWIDDRLGLFLEIAVALLVVGVLLFLLSCAAEGALVGAVGRIDSGEKVRFREAWRVGLQTYWRVLGFKLVQFLLSLLGLLPLLILPLVGAAGWGTDGFYKGLLLDLPVLIVSFLWIFFLGVLALLGLRACVLDGAGPVAAYNAAYRLLLKSFPRVALTGVILSAVGFGVGIVLQVVETVVAAPFLATFLGELANGRWNDLFGTLLVTVAVLLPLSLVLSSAAGAYFATAWTLAYRRFDQDGEVPEPAPLPV